MKGPKWTQKARVVTVPEQIIELLRIEPKTRGDIGWAIGLKQRTIDMHIQQLIQQGYLAGGEYVRGKPAGKVYLTDKGWKHSGPIDPIVYKSEVRPRSRVEQGGIVACALARPSWVFDLGGFNA